MGLKELSSAIKKISTLIFNQKSEVMPFREKIEETFFTPYLPQGVSFQEEHIEEVCCDILTPLVYAHNRVMLYVHGGSFVGGSRKSYRNFCASFAHEASTKIVVPEYRLAPEHPFPAAFDDVLSVLKSLLANNNYVYVAGDTSGACLALALMLNLSLEERKKIPEIILFSPWLDLSSESEIFLVKRSSDKIITKEVIKRCSDIYTYRSNLSNPLVSPLFALESQLQKFPPVYFQMGGQELMKVQVDEFTKKLKRADVKFTLDVYEKMIHFFQIADEYFPEAHLAIEKLGKRIRSCRLG